MKHVEPPAGRNAVPEGGAHPRDTSGSGAVRAAGAGGLPFVPSERETPELSVVVAVAEGGPAVVRCLEGLAAQRDAPAFEVVLPYDDSIPEVATAAAAFAGVRPVAMGHCPTARPAGTPSAQHELIDRRRSAGLAAARGRLIALLEDRSVPRPDWARRIVQAANRGSGRGGVVGGAVACATTDALTRAIFLCDYGRYQLPFEGGARDYVTDVNCLYPRELLERERESWIERYHETTLHWALVRGGAGLHLDPGPVVDHHRARRPLGAILRERMVFGRLFASTRVREATAARRALLAVLAPLLPAVLFARLLRGEISRGHGLRGLASTAPYVLALLTAWSAGEMLGYLSGRE